MRSILARDLAALSSVSGIGKKKAERLVLELQDQFGDVALEPPAPRAGRHRRGGAGAGRAWATGPAAADDAVRAALADGAPPDDVATDPAGACSSSPPPGEGDDRV